MLIVLKFWLVAEFGNSNSHLTDVFEVCGRCVDTNMSAMKTVCSAASFYLLTCINFLVHLD